MMFIIRNVVFILGLTVFSIAFHAKSMDDFFPDAKNNLTTIIWAHAVNSKELLKKAFNSSAMMLEADVVLGELKNGDGRIIPIMAHPPENISDLSLQTFLNDVKDFNEKQNTSKKKGIKLDFKSIEVFETSVNYITELIPQITYPLWLNADILSGPVNATGKPVDAKRFLKGAKTFETALLSLGWTTRYGALVSNAKYTDKQIEEMITTIQNNKTSQLITFPVRAGIAAESLPQLQKLLGAVTNSTLTLWTSNYDPININNLRELILKIGVNKVYVDLPDNIKDKLHLDQSSAASTHLTSAVALFFLSIIFILLR